MDYTATLGLLALGLVATSLCCLLIAPLHDYEVEEKPPRQYPIGTVVRLKDERFDYQKALVLANSCEYGTHITTVYIFFDNGIGAKTCVDSRIVTYWNEVKEDLSDWYEKRRWFREFMSLPTKTVDELLSDHKNIGTWSFNKRSEK